jgi:DNA-directed RNA polymerase specialized sigma24 family protein
VLSQESASYHFPTTSWTVVLAAGGNAPGSAEALGSLCAAYWYPIYAFVRRRGYSREEAEDLTQDFFAQMLEHDTLSKARRERGRFRSFLFASVTHFLANEWDRARTQKRGGACVTLSLDFQFGEERYNREPSHSLTPEALFEKQWALAVLEHVLERLRVEHARKGQEAQFDRLKPFLTGDQDTGEYHQSAIDLNTSDAAVRTAVHRLRRRYAELLREEIAATVADAGEVEGEIRSLLAALGKP